MTSLEVSGFCRDYRAELHFRESPSDREYPLETALNGTPRAVSGVEVAARARLVEKAATRLIAKGRTTL
jgi:hypothetical protein